MLSRRVPRPWHIGLQFFLFFIGLHGLLLAANTTTPTPPAGFQGIPWGSALAELSQLVLVEPDGRVDIYQYKETPPHFANERVESIKLYAIDTQFTRVMIRYRNEATHNRIKQA